MHNPTFYANGKLLLTAEYFVLDGATALALPTKFGQSLTISKNKIPNFAWNSEWFSLDSDKKQWFGGGFNSKDFELAWSSGENVGASLMTILQTAQKLNPNANFQNRIFETALTFPKNWGLGTSSTLIYNIAKYCNINPYTLLARSFGGSGYDIACAGAKKPILFQRENGKPTHQEVDFKPPFSAQLYFVYLEKKQNSKEGIDHYRNKARKIPLSVGTPLEQYFTDISALTYAFLKENDFKNFEKLIIEHENKVADIIKLSRAKDLYFNDYWGEIKSLGAWGGDFVLATSERSFEETKSYFENKGFTTIVKYEDMIL